MNRPMASENINQPLASGDARRSPLWIPIRLIVILFVAILVTHTILRIIFPWDLYFWSESPFMTNLMKMDHHLPIYTSPADGNSFVYSPGLEWITFALLKPFGLQLDVRFCRL